MKRSPNGGLQLTRHAVARSADDVIADRLRHSLRLAERCLEELRPIDRALGAEVRERLAYCSSLVMTPRSRRRP